MAPLWRPKHLASRLELFICKDNNIVHVFCRLQADGFVNLLHWPAVEWEEQHGLKSEPSANDILPAGYPTVAGYKAPVCSQSLTSGPQNMSIRPMSDGERERKKRASHHNSCQMFSLSQTWI